jgi:hypothetical protein
MKSDESKQKIKKHMEVLKNEDPKLAEIAEIFLKAYSENNQNLLNTEYLNDRILKFLQ